jgi:hypothetical protein
MERAPERGSIFESKGSTAPGISDDEIEPPRPIVPPLWERLRERSPLFRGESKRSAARKQEPDFTPTRFIAPAPVERAPEKPAAPVAEARRSATPAPVERESDAAPRRFIAPPPIDHSPEPPPRAVAEPAPIEPQQDLDPPRSVAPPVEYRPDKPMASAVEPRRTITPPPFEPEPIMERPRAAAPPPPERSRSFAPMVEEEPQAAIAPPFEPESVPAPHRTLAPSPVERAPERPPIPPEARRVGPPPPFEAEQDLSRPRPTLPPRAERAPEWPANSAAETRPAASPVFESELNPEPEPPRSTSSPLPERQRHWSALYQEQVEPTRTEPDMESRRSTPPLPVERKPIRPQEAAPEFTESARVPGYPPLERSRDWTPLSATEPRRIIAPRAFEPQPAPEPPRAAAPPPPPVSEPAPVRTFLGVSEEDESEDAQESVFPKLLKRLKTVGRAALPVVPHVLPKEEKIGAAVSAVTAVSTVVTTHAALPVQPAPASPKVDPAPNNENLDALRAAHKDLRDKVKDQSAAIERVEVQMQMLCESVNHTEREQQDLVDELKFFSKWALVFAVAVGVLLMAAVAFDVVLLLRQ